MHAIPSASTDSLPKLLLRNARDHRDEVALREKLLGIWKIYTWGDYYEQVKFLALAFVAQGLEAGDRVAIIAENKPHAYWFELAAQAADGTVVGIFSDCTPKEVAYYLNDAEVRFVVCQDQEQVDKVLEIRHQTPTLQKVIYWDPKGLWNHRDPILMTMDDMLELGRRRDQQRPTEFDEMVARTAGDHSAVFLYTSGTTGNPKGAVVTHQTMVGMARSMHEADPFHQDEENLSFQPLAWITEQVFGIATSLLFKLRVNFPEEPETVQENIREIGPHVVFFGPRLWEGIIRSVQMRIRNASWLHQVFFNAALKVGLRMARHRMDGSRAPLWLNGLYRLADWTVFDSLRDNLGLSNVRVGYMGGSAVSPDVLRYYHAIGVNVKQLYGSSEIGVVTCHRDHDIKPESSGPALPGVELRIAPTGEIQVRSPNLFSGYYKQPEKTAEKFDDGWYCTGDFGRIDETGHLIVMDRLDDVIELASGHRFSPQFVETRLRFSPFIKDVLVVVPDKKSTIATMIDIDLDNVGQWAERHRVGYTTYADLSQKPEVIALVRDEIARVNALLPEHARVATFINLHREFDPDDAEMTRTRKLRRGHAESRYKELIEAIVAGRDSLAVTSEVTYQDGRKGTTRHLISVNAVNGA